MKDEQRRENHKPFDIFTQELQELLDYNECIVEMATNSGNELVQKFLTHVPLFEELTYCRMVDCYLRFLSRVLSALYALKPEMLRSNEHVTVDFVMKHESMDDLINSLIERKVRVLAFESMKKLSTYFERALKLPLFESPEELQTAVLAIEIRNLYVHDHGVVNRTFRQRVPTFPCKIGERIRIDSSLSTAHGNLFMHAATELSIRITENFHRQI